MPESQDSPDRPRHPGRGGPGLPHFDAELEELGELARTAGLQPVGRITAKRKAPDAALFVGKGKADEIKALAEDFQDEQRAVIDRQVEMAFQVALLAGLSAWSNSTSVAPSLASALISSALPLPMNRAASGALRLQITRATGCRPGRLREQAQLFQLAVEMRQAPGPLPQGWWGRRAVGGFGQTGMSGMVGNETPGRERLDGPAPRQVAPASVPSAVWKLTARPGTMVEMACL